LYRGSRLCFPSWGLNSDVGECGGVYPLQAEEKEN
jgi:hypothetical protein